MFDELHQLPGRISGKRVIVIGGGDAAFDYALSLIEQGAHPVIVSRSEPSCLGLLRDRTEALGVELIIGAEPSHILRLGRGIALECSVGRSKVELDGDLVLMACGRVPNTEVLSAGLRHTIGARRSGLPETNVRGLYLAGDVARERQRQTGIAVGDGILAAMLVQRSLGER